MLNDFDRHALNKFSNPKELEDIFEYLDFFFGFNFPCCPCIFIKQNPDLLVNYEIIRFHILRIWEDKRIDEE